MLVLGQSPVQPDQYRSSIKSPVYCIRPLQRFAHNLQRLLSNHNYDSTRFQSQLTMQLETALCNQYCFCNTELRTATVTKIKGLLIQTQRNTFVLFTLLKLTLDERKTLTKISICNLSQQFPQASARFGHDEIRKPAKSILHWQGLPATSVSPGGQRCPKGLHLPRQKRACKVRRSSCSASSTRPLTHRQAHGDRGRETVGG